MKLIFGFCAFALTANLAAKSHTQINILRSAPYDTSCQADSDCMPAPGCCPVPCTSLVINRKDLSKAEAALHCPKENQCPAAGSCRTHAYLCVRKTCKLVFSGDKDYRPR
jgi:hypothetical protein